MVIPRNRVRGVVIHGGDRLDTAYGSQQAALVGVDGSGLNGVTVSYPQGHGVWLESGRLWIVNSTLPYVRTAIRGWRWHLMPKPSHKTTVLSITRAVISVGYGPLKPLATQPRDPAPPEHQKPLIPLRSSPGGVPAPCRCNSDRLPQSPPNLRFPNSPIVPIPATSLRLPRARFPQPGTYPRYPFPMVTLPSAIAVISPSPPPQPSPINRVLPQPPPSYASANVPPTRLQFRITVIPRSDQDIQLVQVLMPDALTLRRRDGSITQSAAFRHRDRAEAVLEELQRNGLNASLQSLDRNN